MAKNISTLGKYDQRRLWKWICIVNPFDLLLKKCTKNNLSLDNKNLKWGKYHYAINIFLKCTLDTIIGTPRNSWVKYLPFIFTILSTPGWLWTFFLFHRNINRRENKDQIPLIMPSYGTCCVFDAEKLVHAFMTTRLDYCNALLGGCPASSINKLQIVQNAAARVLTRSRKYDHITLILFTNFTVSALATY